MLGRQTHRPSRAEFEGPESREGEAHCHEVGADIPDHHELGRVGGVELGHVAISLGGYYSELSACKSISRYVWKMYGRCL